MDDGMRKGFELAGLMVAAGLSFLIGALNLAEGLTTDSAWQTIQGAISLGLALLFATQARRVHNEEQAKHERNRSEEGSR